MYETVIALPTFDVARTHRQCRATLVFLTNNFTFPPKTITALYKSRWQIELFFDELSSTFESSRFLILPRTR